MRQNKKLRKASYISKAKSCDAQLESTLDGVQPAHCDFALPDVAWPAARSAALWAFAEGKTPQRGKHFGRNVRQTLHEFAASLFGHNRSMVPGPTCSRGPNIARLRSSSTFPSDLM